MIREGGRPSSKEGKPTRGSRIWVRVSSTRWKVDLVKEDTVLAGRKWTHSRPPLRWNPRVRRPLITLLATPYHSSDDVGYSTPDHIQQVLSADKNAPGDPDENKSNWKSTAAATAKFFLRGVRESADAFGPLKSVAGDLCFILENCEVRPSHICYPQYLPVPSERRQISKR